MRECDNGPVDELTRRVRAHFDAYGDAEWNRLVSTPRDRVSLEVHRRFLTEVLPSRGAVLEVGAGTGRFTIELARLGLTVLATDISEVQLDLNERHVGEAGFADAITDRRVLDIRDAATTEGGPFDAVVAYGGPLSYVFDDAGSAFGALVRAVRPGGVVVASVMATIGNLRHYLPVAVHETRQFGTTFYDQVIAGDLRGLPASHTCRMFRWREIQAMIELEPCHLVAASASNWLSLSEESVISELEADDQLWPWFLDWETAICREPGALDGGTHILFAVRRDV